MSDESWVEFDEHFIDVIPLTGDRPAEEASLFRVAMLQCGRSVGRFRKHEDAVRVAQTIAHHMDLMDAVTSLADECEHHALDMTKEELIDRVAELNKLVNNPTQPSNTEDKIPS